MNLLWGRTLGQKRLFRVLRGGEVVVGDHVREAAEDLFRERCPLVVCAKSGLDVTDFDAFEEADQRPGKDCRGVPLHQQRVGLEPLNDLAKPLQSPL